MRLAAIIFVLGTVAGVVPPDHRLIAQEGTRKKSAPKSKDNHQALTGCVDEQDGRYVLLDDRMLNLAELEAVGASNEDFFAKHVGHKVTVKGTKASEADARFKVTSIEDISSACTPAQPSPQ